MVKLPSFYALGHALVGNSAPLPETSRTLKWYVIKNDPFAS